MVQNIIEIMRLFEGMMLLLCVMMLMYVLVSQRAPNNKDSSGTEKRWKPPSYTSIIEELIEYLRYRNSKK